MQILRKRLGATVLAACLLVVLTFGGAIALAAGEWPLPGGGNTLTITAATSSSNQTSLATDMSDSSVTLVVDVYKVAEATQNPNYQTYDYELTDHFRGVDGATEAFNKAQVGHAADWEAFAGLLATHENLEGVPVSGSAQFGTDGFATVSLAEDGIYLIMPHGEGLASDSLAAYGPIRGYAFKPYMVALPTTYNEGYAEGGILEGDVSTADTGGWHRDVKVALKVEETPLFGSLKIVKKLTTFRGTPVTFGFNIDSVEGSPVEYHGYKSILLTEGTVNDEDGLVENIPAGAIVTVTETNDGAGYQFLEAQNAENIKIISNEVAGDNVEVVTVTNEPSDDTPGYGVENTFEWDEENGDWELVSVTPAGAQQAASKE